MLKITPSRSNPFSSLRWAKIERPPKVTTVSEEEVRPEYLGLKRDAIEAIWSSVVSYYRLRMQPSMSLCIRYRGQVVLDRAIGFARGADPDDPRGTPRVLATPNTLYSLFSASKVVTGTLVHRLIDEGVLQIDAPVASYIPGFAQHGKGDITIRQVLCHQAGLARTPREQVDLDLIHDPERLLESLCAMRPQSKPGREVAYHALTGCFILQMVMEAATGQGIRQILDDRLRNPLGFAHLTYGVSPDRVGDLAKESVTGPPATAPFAQWVVEALGVSFSEAIALANDPRFLTGIIPAGNVVATANELSRFFEIWRHNGELDGVRVLSPQAVARARVAQNSGLRPDGIMKVPVRFGLGVMLGSRQFSLFGPDTENAFGHLGFTNILGWTDPDREISVGFLNNGKPFIAPEQVAWLSIPRTISQHFPPTRR